MRAYTDLEQSKKLTEILPLESADLYYDISFDNEYHIQMPTNGYFGNKRFFIQFPEAVPCWSLTALMDVLDRGILFKTPQGWAYQIYIEYKAITSDFYSNPIDAVFEMVYWLKENGKL